MTEKPNCYDCQHRRSIPGDAHSQCVHPALGPQSNNMFTALFEAMQHRAETAAVAQHLHVTAHPTGVQRGWFMWPANFDPTWLRTCDGYTKKG